MLPDKYRKFKTRIVTYLLVFIFLAFATILAGGLANIKKVVLYISPDVITYFVSINDPEVNIKTRITITSPGSSSNKIFTFPIRLPEDAKLEGYTIAYPWLVKGQPITYSNHVLTWHGILPQKRQVVVFNITYHYSTFKNKLTLPLGTVGLFKFKNTFTDIRININGTLKDYDSNYEFKTSIENFHTKLHYSQELNKKSKDLLLKW